MNKDELKEIKEWWELIGYQARSELKKNTSLRLKHLI